MGLSSIFNPDILIGMGQGHEKYQQNLISEEAARRKEMHSTLSHLFDAPNITPEAQDEILRQISEGTQAPLNKPYKYDLNKVTQVRPRVGGSVAPTMTMPELKAPQGSAMAGLTISPESTFNAPEAPADARRSGFYSPDEMDTRKLEAYRRQQGVLTEEDIKRERAKQQAELEFNTSTSQLKPPAPPEPFTLSPGQSRFNADGTVKASVPPNDPSTGVPKSLQDDEYVLKNGKHAMAFFNPDPVHPGYFTKDPETQKLIDITDQVVGKYHAPPQAPAQQRTRLVQTVDNDGNPISVIVPDVAGSEFMGALTSVEKNRRSQADIIDNYADHILDLIKKNPNSVGPILGRLARGETVVGVVSPEAKALGTALGSFEALQPILHGFRGGSQTMDHFHSVIGDQSLNAAALAASIQEIKALARDIRAGRSAEVLQDMQSPSPSGQRGAGSPDAGLRREQHSPSTGRYRYTLDGGKTWIEGRLPK